MTWKGPVVQPKTECPIAPLREDLLPIPEISFYGKMIARFSRTDLGRFYIVTGGQGQPEVLCVKGVEDADALYIKLLFSVIEHRTGGQAIKPQGLQTLKAF